VLFAISFSVLFAVKKIQPSNNFQRSTHTTNNNSVFTTKHYIKTTFSKLKNDKKQKVFCTIQRFLEKYFLKVVTKLTIAPKSFFT